MSEIERHHAPRSQLILGFALVYVIWGSTYLAIRFAIASIPPLLMAGARFLVAGLILYVLLRRSGVPRPTRAQWKSATLLGALFLLGGNGVVSKAEEMVPSGVAALIVAVVPLWMVLLNALDGKIWPRLSVLAGVALGIAGMAVLVMPGGAGANHIDPVGVAMLLTATLSWAVGSLYAHRIEMPASMLLGTGMEMLGGGVLLLVAGSLSGEWMAFDPSGTTQKSLLAFLYLIFFGSLLGFTAYVWLLKVTTPARASTYAFVNPVIAVFLGWALADEPLSLRVVVATLVIVAAVALILYFGAARDPAYKKTPEGPTTRPALKTESD